MMTFALKKCFDSQEVSFWIGRNLSSGGRKIILPSVIFDKGFLGPDFFPIWSIPKAQDFRDILHMSGYWDVSISSPFIGYEGKTDLHFCASLQFVQPDVTDRDELFDILLFLRFQPKCDKNNSESRCSNKKKTAHVLRKNLLNIITENAPVLQKLLIQNFEAVLKHGCERWQKQTIVDQTIQQTASALTSIVKHSTNETFTLRCQRYIGCNTTYEVEKALMAHLQKIVLKIMGQFPEDQEDKAALDLNNSVLQMTSDVDKDDDFEFLLNESLEESAEELGYSAESIYQTLPIISEKCDKRFNQQNGPNRDKIKEPIVESEDNWFSEVMTDEDDWLALS
ncbi:uncharacterized protein LOC143226661 isoform X2 [Tachypleus tridentatus]